MTAPKRWPKNAERARLASLAAAREIVELGSKVKQAIAEGKRELALMWVSEMQIAAKDIQVRMLLAKNGKALDDE
jgi:hypothetical protein